MGLTSNLLRRLSNCNHSYFALAGRPAGWIATCAQTENKAGQLRRLKLLAEQHRPVSRNLVQGAWGATLGETSNLLFFLSPSTVKAERRASNDLEAVFKKLHSGYRWWDLQPFPGDPEIDLRNATSYVSLEPINQWSALVGASAIRIDPLSSQGIQVSISTAEQLSIAINTLVKLPENKSFALDFYRDLIKRRAQGHTQLQLQHQSYSEAGYNSSFWISYSRNLTLRDQNVAANNKVVNYESTYELSKEAKFSSVPAIKDKFIRPCFALQHPALEQPCFIENRAIIDKVLRQLIDVSLKHVLRDPENRTPRDQLEKLLLFWVSSGILVAHSKNESL